jgi:3-oxoacyl-(acyl-carrier-protein) synthase
MMCLMTERAGAAESVGTATRWLERGESPACIALYVNAVGAAAAPILRRLGDQDAALRSEAYAICLERRDHARTRGAVILAPLAHRAVDPIQLCRRLCGAPE